MNAPQPQHAPRTVQPTQASNPRIENQRAFLQSLVQGLQGTQPAARDQERKD